MKNSCPKKDSDKDLYSWQNRKIHKARGQLNMSLDDCRELARQINGKASISSLSLPQRWELIEILKAKGARIRNIPLSKIVDSPQGGHQAVPARDGLSVKLAPINRARLVDTKEKPEDIYPACLGYWNERFPKPRPGFATNEQLAYIQTLWEIDFNDGRSGRGLRGFIFRQTKSLEQGPVSDLTFLRSHHVMAVLMPLKKKAKHLRGGA